MEKKPLTDKQRVDYLTKLMENGSIIPNGDQLLMEKNNQAIPVGVFVKKKDNAEDTFFAAPSGIILFEANEFYKYVQDKGKELFLKNLDRELKQKIDIISIKEKNVKN